MSNFIVWGTAGKSVTDSGGRLVKSRSYYFGIDSALEADMCSAQASRRQMRTPSCILARPTLGLLQIDYRWAAVNAEAMERFAKELVALLVAGPSLQELLNPVDFKR